MLKVTKPIQTLGRIDTATINNQVLRIDGWVASFNSGILNGFKVSIAGRKVHNFELTLGISSPDIQEVYPYLKSPEKARFCIKIPLLYHKINDVLIIITPLFNGCEGGILLTVLNSSLPQPKEEDITLVGSDFEVAYFFLGYFIQLAGLASTDRVLDVGCGVGRMAYGLAHYLKPTGGYEGFDIISDLIQWAQQNITPRVPHFNFRQVNIYNQMYNPTGTVQAPDFIFPYPDESFDFVFLTSVFTHLPAQEVRHYLDEIYRVLKPGGRCLCTCFLLNEESELGIAQGSSIWNIKHELEDCFTNNPEVPENAIGYKEELLLEWITDRNLTVTGKYYGYWCGRNRFTSMQDILILNKNYPSRLKRQNEPKIKGLPNPLPAKTIKQTEPVLTFGRLDVAIVENQKLRLDGWVASFNSGRVSGFKVLISGKELADFELLLGLSSPDVKEIYPHLDHAENARFCLYITLSPQQQEEFQNAPIILIPLCNDSQGVAIESRLSFAVHQEVVRREIQQHQPQSSPEMPIFSSPEKQGASHLQKIKADLERSRSYLQKIQTDIERVESTQLQPHQVPISEPRTPVENKLPKGDAQNWQAFYPGLLGLSEISYEKFWQFLDPAIQAQIPYLDTTTPKISIITPTWNSSLDWFVETALSVLTQSTLDWEWCIADDGSKSPEIRTVLVELAQKHPRIKIAFLESGGISSATNHALKMASGDYVCFLDHDDTLAPTALQDSLNKLGEGFDAVYSDEDKIDFSGLHYVEPFFKPDWSPEYFRGVMYVGHLLCVRRELAIQVGGFNSEYDGVQDYEFMLRVSELTSKIGHLPRILYHWRKIPGSIAGQIDAKPRIGQLQQGAISSHLSRLGLPAIAEPGLGGHRVNINPRPRNHHPLISIIIPIEDNDTPIENCLQNIISMSTYPNVEVIVVENEIESSKSLRFEHLSSVKSIKLRETFTPARAGNLGAKSALGEYLVFLRDWVEVITNDWLRHLLYYAEQPDVGAVGSLLLFPNKTIKHAGLVLGGEHTINWVMRGFSSDSDGYAGSLVCAREVSAVTDSCMMVKKSEFERIGGFNEHFFTYYQNIDLCLRLQKEGKRIIFTPRSVLICHQATRGQKYTDKDSVDRMLLLDQWEMGIELGDPYYNPNFDIDLNNYTIRV